MALDEVWTCTLGHTTPDGLVRTDSNGVPRCGTCHEALGGEPHPLFHGTLTVLAPPPPTPDEQAFAILETLTEEQRGALGHLLNNALAPVVLEAAMICDDEDAVISLIQGAVRHLRDVVNRVVDGGH